MSLSDTHPSKQPAPFPSAKDFPRSLFLHPSRSRQLPKFSSDQSSTRTRTNSSVDQVFHDQRFKRFPLNQTSKKRENTPKINEQGQLNRKLLSEIHCYRRHTIELKKQNQYILALYAECNHNYNQLRKAHLDLRQRYQEHHPFVQPASNTQSRIKALPTMRLDNDLDMKITLSKNVTMHEFGEEKKRQSKIEELQQCNRKLEQEVKCLRGELESYRTSNSALAPQYKCVTTQTKQCEQSDSEVLISSQSEDCSKQLSKQSSREAVLELRVKKLEDYIREIETRHNKLRDRCDTIRHLISSEAPAF